MALQVLTEILIAIIVLIILYILVCRESDKERVQRMRDRLGNTMPDFSPALCEGCGSQLMPGRPEKKCVPCLEQDTYEKWRDEGLDEPVDAETARRWMAREEAERAHYWKGK